MGWTSKASANQRAGRAGRMGPGHCYRIFSSTVFNDKFKEFSVPELERVPIESVVLQMKGMGINQVVGFPFPSPPNQEAIKIAENLLLYLGALEQIGNLAKITPVGQLMSQFPIHPRFSKMLIVAAQQKSENLIPFIATIVAGLSVGELFLRDLVQEQDEDEADNSPRKQYFKVMQMFAGQEPTSDVLMMLTAIGAYLAQLERAPLNIHEFCEKHYLRTKAMDEMMKLRSQLFTLLRKLEKEFPMIAQLSNKMSPPNPKQKSLIKQILLCGYGDQVARIDPNLSGYGKSALPMYQLSNLYAEGEFLIHPSSCLFRTRPSPQWIIYSQIEGQEERLNATETGVIGRALSSRQWLKGVTLIDETWLPRHVKPLCHTTKILAEPEPSYDPKEDEIYGFAYPSFGPKQWELKLSKVALPSQDQTAWFARFLLQGDIPLPQPLFKLITVNHLM